MDLNKYDTLEEKLKNVNYGNVMLKFIRKRLGFKSYGELYPREVEIFLYENLNVNTTNKNPDMPTNQIELNAYSITMHYLKYYRGPTLSKPQACFLYFLLQQKLYLVLQ